MHPHDNTIPLGFCQCGCGQRTTLIIESHPGRGLVKGEYRRFVQGHHVRLEPIPRVRKSLVERFWEKVEKSDGCWTWQGSRNEKGYGALQLSYARGKQTMQAAHRVAWFLTSGPIPSGLFVCHRCDNPSCVRPDHLFLGTCADNMADMAIKGRSLRGTRNPRAKLTPEAVAAIRAERQAGTYLRVLAARYCVTISTINQIMRGAIWP